jgi:hypothetical protein
MGIATFLISTLEGLTEISRIDKRSQALAYAQANLDWFFEAVVRSSAVCPRRESARISSDQLSLPDHREEAGSVV